MDPKDVVTASLDAINVATAGFLPPAPAPGPHSSRCSELHQRRADSGARFNALTDPASLRDGFKPTGTRYALAARITGPVTLSLSAGRAARPKPPAGPPIAHMAKSTVPANIVIVADTDLLMDYMWVQTRELFGQRVAQAFANNGDLVANVLDNLSGSGALISIRGRATFTRPFERVEALKRRADDRLRSKVLELQIGAAANRDQTHRTAEQEKRSEPRSC